MTEVRNSRCNLFNLMQVQILVSSLRCVLYNRVSEIFLSLTTNDHNKNNTSTPRKTTVNAKQSSIT